RGVRPALPPSPTRRSSDLRLRHGRLPRLRGARREGAGSMSAEGYDYIVAGGGSSGCLVAARLAGAGARVLLLEAGPDDRNPLIRDRKSTRLNSSHVKISYA